MNTKHVGFGLVASLIAVCGCGGQPDGGGALTLGTTSEGTIQEDDNYTVPVGGQGAGSMVKGDSYTITLTPGAYTVRMCNRGTDSTFDTYIEMYGAAGSMSVAYTETPTSLGEYVRDDDSAEGLQSRLRVTVAVAGEYTLVARTFGGGAPSGVAENAARGGYNFRIDAGDMPTVDCPIM